MLDSTFTGLVTGLTLIVAIGAQNAYVLRQGLARDHVGIVVAICTVSDVILIVAGVSGIGTIVEKAPWAIDVVRWFGVAFLTWYGVSTLLRARRAEALHAAHGGSTGRRGIALRALALTWLNPHVYLDTVLLLGSIANHEGPTGRWWFALGACVASTLWFCGLGYGARLAGRVLASPRAWQVLDVLIGLTMLAIAAKLATG
ncbi:MULTISPECIES: LysE/ArgO family amino acid transporter [unclassified Nocardioides]|uniref:LysE/ArgO family amino acid transporter n=1 Tax=unclassified Nocardioides TaxID=2615069 RepID=UPI0009F0DAA7|nr:MULTISPECIES: LysE/ArgO family amino acid transporter [unclassified Nocardioides]GAW52014.1 lysine exporter protein LysE/YggA [Nocardioides sp. PD653-B2]GAW56380.1 lysine exporter protein LysE/YggA [Nocardioides sp. PD653]